MADFDILRRVGEGSFSTVLLARYQGDGQLYAIKMINKSLVLRNKVGAGASPCRGFCSRSGNCCC
jgi:3-phosphoinositide dependent protein kinase-1